ncbi:MAG: GntR family transcriptional regulator [Lachnospiraceae bacterium]|nr:GntR family transcriptional regulator [Lachnospiraceae bacterium]
MALGAVGKKVSLTEKAYQMLREAILSGELKPGEVLTEEGMADLLQISRTPVRSALQQLASEGFLESGRKNLTVARVDAEELRDIDQVRAELEPLSAKLACQKGLTEEQAKELRAYCQGQEQAAREEDVKSFFHAGENFHIRLAEFSGNPFLASMISRASMAAVRYLTNQARPEHFLDASGAEHERVLAAVLSGDAEAARRAMKKHIQGERGGKENGSCETDFQRTGQGSADHEEVHRAGGESL